MDKVKIILENGIEKEVDGIFYLYNTKYYFMYTEKEIDENGYVVLHLVQVGKEMKNTPQGPADTGYMVGVEITDQNEWGAVQQSITKIVEDKKNNTQSEGIQYLPISMLSTLKIMSKKTFRLMRSVIEGNFGVDLGNITPQAPVSTANTESVNTVPTQEVQTQTTNVQPSNSYANVNTGRDDSEVIVDYRSRFFEEQEKNIALEAQLNELLEKIENIKNIIE